MASNSVLKTQYFLTSAIVGAYLPYLPLHLAANNFSDFDVGMILSSAGLAMLFMPLIIGYLADHHFGNRRILICALTGSALLLSLLAISQSFYLVLGSFFALSLLLLPLMPALDSTTMNYLKGSDALQRNKRYTEIRIFCSLGFISPAIMLYPILPYLSDSPQIALCFAALIAFVAALNACYLQDDKEMVIQRNIERSSSSIAEAWHAISKSSLGIFLLVIFLLYLGMGTLDTFQTRYINALGIGVGAAGVLGIAGSALEIPFALWGTRIYGKIGARGILMLGTLASMIRYFALSFYPSSQAVVFTQILHGPMTLAMVFLPPCYFDGFAENRFRTSIHSWYALSCHGIAKFFASIGGAVIVASSSSAESELQRLANIYLFAAICTIMAGIVIVRNWRKL